MKEAKALERVNAVVYARYSSRSQGEQSIEGQLERAHLYAKAKGYTIIHEYIDRAQSGRTDNRADFQQMLKDTAKKQFQVIIVWKVDRFGRNREEITINKSKCKRNGVRVEYIAENIPDSPEGVILESLMEGLAEYYSIQLAQNVSRGLRISAEKCQYAGGVCPLGYTIDKSKHFVINPDTAPIIKYIFTAYADGIPKAEIVRQLNSKGFRAGNGKPFTKNSLSTILHNIRYTGTYKYGDILIENGIPQIIEPELFEKAQEMSRKHKSSHPPISAADYILSDKTVCGVCGAPMIGDTGTGKSGRQYHYYTCAKRKSRREKCPKKSIRQDLLEDMVIDAVRKLVSDKELMEQIADKTYAYYVRLGENDDTVPALKSKLAEVQRGIDNLIKAAEMGIISPDMKTRMDDLTEQKNELLDSIEAAEMTAKFRLTRDQILFFLLQFCDADMDDPECQKRLINTFINAVVVHDDRVIVSFNFSGEKNSVTLHDLNSITESDPSVVFEREGKSGELGTRTPDPLRVMQVL